MRVEWEGGREEERVKEGRGGNSDVSVLGIPNYCNVLLCVTRYH